MKKIINGKLYDTETARSLCWYDNGLSNTDFCYYEEQLFQKKTGEFFLSGSGGPMSKYREAISMREWTGGDSIIPLTIDEAKKWLEQYGDVDTYAEIFGLPEE